MMYFFLKKEKDLEIALFYTCVSNILMIWSTVFEMWQIEIGDYGSFFALLPP